MAFANRPREEGNYMKTHGMQSKSKKQSGIDPQRQVNKSQQIEMGFAIRSCNA